MIDVEVVAAELEDEAQAGSWARNHRIIQFTTAEGNPAMALVTVTVAVPAVTEANDTFSFAFQSAAGAVSLDVLANDVDPVTGNNSTLRVGSVTQPAAGQGSVAIAADGRSVVWNRPANFTGTAQFSYTAVRA